MRWAGGAVEPRAERGGLGKGKGGGRGGRGRKCRASSEGGSPSRVSSVGGLTVAAGQGAGRAWIWTEEITPKDSPEKLGEGRVVQKSLGGEGGEREGASSSGGATIAGTFRGRT